jgi:hypothetical protein
MVSSEGTVREGHLLLTCSLAGSCDHGAVRTLLEQYGLHSDHTRDGLSAAGEVPSVFGSMQGEDIAVHLASRIEDAAPGTRVARIQVLLLGTPPTQ